MHPTFLPGDRAHLWRSSGAETRAGRTGQQRGASRHTPPGPVAAVAVLAVWAMRAMWAAAQDVQR